MVNKGSLKHWQRFPAGEQVNTALLVVSSIRLWVYLFFPKGFSFPRLAYVFSVSLTFLLSTNSYFVINVSNNDITTVHILWLVCLYIISLTHIDHITTKIRDLLCTWKEFQRKRNMVSASRGFPTVWV